MQGVIPGGDSANPRPAHDLSRLPVGCQSTTPTACASAAPISRDLIERRCAIAESTVKHDQRMTVLPAEATSRHNQPLALPPGVIPMALLSGAVRDGDEVVVDLAEDKDALTATAAA
jgi:hypothetical protein